MKVSEAHIRVAFVLTFSLLGVSRAAADFRVCDSDQTGEITLAFLSAYPFLDAAKKEINAIRDGGDPSHFERWFGHIDKQSEDDDINERRQDYIEALIDAVAYDAIDQADYICGPSFKCNSWNPDVRAWTDGSAEKGLYGIFVCDTFFNENDKFQTGVLVHEYSHLYGTDDWADGYKMNNESYEDAARRLAREHPDDAVFNAYNFGFFVMDR